MIIAVASGKGGTGKTTVAVNLALVIAESRSVEFLDTDVEEPNAHIFLNPTFTESEEVSIAVPSVDERLCTHCGRCGEVCAFGAIMAVNDRVLVFADMCHGCGGCTLLCPQRAVSETPRTIGVVDRGHAGKMRFVRGKLNAGEPMSPPVIRGVKSGLGCVPITIIDVPPGTSCPMVESVRGSDFCLLVTEPTPFGLHDLRLAIEVVRKLGIPAGVVVNRSDIGGPIVQDYCDLAGVPVLMSLPFDRQMAQAYADGIPAISVISSWRERFVELAARIAGPDCQSPGGW